MAGFTLDRESIARISQMLRTYEQGMLSPPDIPGPDGSYTPAVQVVKVTGAKDAAGWQPGTIQIWNNASSSFTTGITCHIRASDGSTLATNSIMLGRLSSVESNVPVFIVGPAGLSAEEADGSPSYTGVTKLQFDQADGFSLSNPSTGTTRVDILAATASQAGIVSTTTQTFGGDKTFTNNVYISQTAYVEGQIYIGNNTTLEWSIKANNSNSLVIYSAPNYSGNYPVEIQSTSTTNELFLSAPSGTKACSIYADSTTAYFRCNYNNGLTGTLKTGAISTGGIITNLGNTSTQSSSWMGF